MSKRLLLVGDDDALDVLAELSRHLDYFEVARMDEPPDDVADADVVIAYVDGARTAAVLASAVQAGVAHLITMMPNEPSLSTGARAILTAAELIKSCAPSTG